MILHPSPMGGQTPKALLHEGNEGRALVITDVLAHSLYKLRTTGCILTMPWSGRKHFAATASLAREQRVRLTWARSSMATCGSQTSINEPPGFLIPTRSKKRFKENQRSQLVGWLRHHHHYTPCCPTEGTTHAKSRYTNMTTMTKNCILYLPR